MHQPARPAAPPSGTLPPPGALRNGSGRRLVALAAAGLHLALDAVLPPRCLACGGVVAGGAALCPGCWSGMALLGPPQCATCGYPFPHADAAESGEPEAFAEPEAVGPRRPGDGLLCAACIRQPPAFERARAALRYDDASRGMILAFKHGDRTHGAPGLAAIMAVAGAPLLRDAGLIVPVPLHWTRLLRRRYNQSALLASALARQSGVPAAPDLLLRRRLTRSQGGLGASGRRRNVAGAFAVRPRWRVRLAGCRVLLVDDVHTSGATVEACATTLRRAGAAAVDVLTLARVVRPARPPG